ncbi:glycosyltransferase [Candidatus Magnetomonas plexicatena]|uniref:glycosyltransferase n=1 Tax=Candidatus Magnetomonas plexicatena TaxID=2552947 RepID=UPI001C752BB7|nr:glycosyltransferase [Nitrospirales bacterium LBB_01]
MTIDNKMVIVIPVFNDWDNVSLLLPLISSALSIEVNDVGNCEVLLVDDASTIAFKRDFRVEELAHIKAIKILRLKRNMGHQRAIAIGLYYVRQNLTPKAVVIMDGDGEDSPSDLPRLINTCAESSFSKIVFACRKKRSEGIVFRFFYLFYKLIFRFLTGVSIRIGNYSVIPGQLLGDVIALSDIWLHYASGIMKSHIDKTEIAVDRAKRLSGESKMNFTALIMHGIRAISVYGGVVGVRLLLFSLVVAVTCSVLILVTIFIRFFTALAIPGWATNVVMTLFVIILQTMLFILFFIFVIFQNIDYNLSFAIEKEYSYLVDNVTDLT